MDPRSPPRCRRVSLPSSTEESTTGTGTRPGWVFPAVLFTLALVLRLAFVWLGPGPGFVPTGDQVDYHHLAVSLSRGDGYVLPDGEGNTYPTAFRPPLYPFALSPAYALFGGKPVLGLITQALLGALLAVAVWSLGRRLWDETSGRLAGLAVAVYPLLIFFSGMLLSEVLYALCLVMATFPLAAWWKRGGTGTALFAGLVLGLATLARPTAPAWAALLVLLAVALRIRPFPRLGRETLALMLGGALMVLPWTARNAISLGEFVPLTTGGGCALYDGNNPYVVENPEMHGAAWSLRSIEPYATEFRGKSEIEIDRLSLRHAVAFWRDNPGLLPSMALWKQARFWRASAQAGRTGWWVAPDSGAARIAQLFDPLMLSYGLVLPFFLVGLILALRRPREGAFVLPVIILSQALLATLYWGSLRFRVPVEPFILLLAAHGMVTMWRALHRRRVA
jgi:4-amino-4-deoxy-L-arabinose transferase-like glycosyltransferase